MIEKIKNNFREKTYFGKDLAIIIPTKNRPKEVIRLLKSVSEQDCKVGRILIIASGQDIQDLVMSFSDHLPVEYFSSEPGQIRQRNKGIALLEDTTRLVATIDDDVEFHKTAISEMIKFWNSVEPDTAGVGFNIINQDRHKHTWLKGVLGVSVPEPGRVIQCGLVTSITNVKQNIKSDWLNGGATVWRREILRDNLHAEINSGWAVYEDLIFSYPIGKKYPLYISKDSKIEIDNTLSNDENLQTYKYRGKTQCIWGAYFISINPDMSIFKFIYFKLLQLIINFIKSIKKKHKLFEGIGIIQGLIIISHAFLVKKGFSKIIEDHT